MAAPKFPITKDRIRNHFHYYWWQYLALALCATLGLNLIFNMTKYQPPEELKMEWYYQGASSHYTADKCNALLEELAAELFPHMEGLNYNVVGTDDTYGDMQLMVWMAAGQGDLYMLQKASFTPYANEGSMVNLQPYVDDGTLNVEGIDLTDGYGYDPDTGVKGLYGIPGSVLQGFWEYDMQPDGLILCLPIAGGNVDNALILLDYLLDNMR